MSSLLRLGRTVGAVLSLAVAVPASAQSLLVNTNPASKGVYDELYIDGPAWSAWLTTSAMLHNTFGPNFATTPTLSDLSYMLQYDALWVDQRWHSAPTALEVANLAAYAATGRRVVLMGEDATWGPWNNAVLGAVGGAEGPGQTQDWYWSYGHVAPGCLDGAAHTVLAHALTKGVSSVNMSCGGYALGGTALFDYNVATLWGPQQNVLSILDANILDDRFNLVGDGKVFRENVMEWVATPTSTPEPATLALLGTGLLAVGAVARRRRTPRD